MNPPPPVENIVRATLLPVPTPPETVAQRIQRLQAEARTLAKDHMRELCAAITRAEAVASEIAEGGEAYPAGVRDLARRFAQEAELRVQAIMALVDR